MLLPPVHLDSPTAQFMAVLSTHQLPKIKHRVKQSVQSESSFGEAFAKYIDH